MHSSLSSPAVAWNSRSHVPEQHAGRRDVQGGLRNDVQTKVVTTTQHTYLVSATSADVFYNLDGLVPADDILRKTGPDHNWIGLPLYIGMDALQPIMRTARPFLQTLAN